MEQHALVEALMKPETYDETVRKIELVQTHISFVFLAGDYVYKVKKPVNFGFLDFTTLEKRKFFCGRELELNRRLAGDMYLEVVPINRSDNQIKIKGQGETIEYAVKMRRIPEDTMMSGLLEQNQVDNGLIDELAKKIAEFHAKAETGELINNFGSLETIKFNWDENFDQTYDFIGRTINSSQFDLIHQKIQTFLKENQPLFRTRIEDGRIRDCHGDLHSGNIFIADRIYIFDCIEFNQRFRYSDVTADVAFLAMDLDFRNRRDLSTYFVDRYVEYSQDRTLLMLLHFYKCYRAYVRGKVIGFKLDDPNVETLEKDLAKQESRAYFDLATEYANEL
ncbi:MAG: phosphotransferase [Candidatus Heimdallarchaeota archaeon]